MATGGRLDVSEYKVCDVRLVSSSFLLFCSEFHFQCNDSCVNEFPHDFLVAAVGM